MAQPRVLGVLLCYNDGDILADNIEYLLHSGHDVIAWNHGSTDETAAVLDRYRSVLREATFISREVDFYDMYPLLSRHLLANYVRDYDWVSWPDADEILEGPDRSRPYREWIREAYESPHNWIVFNDCVFWFTSQDPLEEHSPTARVRRYALSDVGPKKIRAWRASATNIRWFNHNPTKGTQFPRRFNLRHYPMRSAAHVERRLAVDRAGLRRGPISSHYDHMQSVRAKLQIPASALHVDDGEADLVSDALFDWSAVFGQPAPLPPRIALSFTVATERWHLAAALTNVLRVWRAARTTDLAVKPRLDSWIAALSTNPAAPVLVVLRGTTVSLAFADLARQWDEGRLEDSPATPGTVDETIEIAGGRCRVRVSAADRRLVVDVEARSMPPVVAVMPLDSFEGARFGVGSGTFHLPTDGRYMLAFEPAPIGMPPESGAAGGREPRTSDAR